MHCTFVTFALGLVALPGAYAQTPTALATSPFGFSCDHHTTFTLDTYCARTAEAGITWIRGFPTAGTTEPERGKFEWAEIDKFLRIAAENRMAVSGLLFYLPPWIETDGVKLPVKDLPGWSEYVSQVVTHSKDRVKHWEVWNETPNFIGEGKAEDYAKTVVAAYDAAKAADPACQVGLSIQSNNVNWIEQVIQAGAKEHYDYISVHPYETLGLVETDGCEPEFMSIVPTIRKMLAAQDPARVEAPIWFTEIGYDAGEGEVHQASALVKAFAMGLAQGVARINWFEGIDGDSGPMGLLRADGTPRLAYAAMTNLTRLLGANPNYEGRVHVESGYAFVFQGAAGPVVVAWTPPGTTGRVSFDAPVRVMDPLTGATTQGTSCALTNVPVLVTDLPPTLVGDAQAYGARPFPWHDGYGYSQASSVWIAMGEPGEERGLHHIHADRSSTGCEAYGVPARDCSKGAGQSFSVAPEFLSYTTEPITITAVLRRKAENEDAGFNLWYESTTGIRGTGEWYTIPGNDQWYTKTWTITDAQFVGKWGYNFVFNGDIPRPYYLRSATVSKVE